MSTTVNTHPKAFALRPVRMDVKNNCFINYEGTTFPKNPKAGCEMYLRRAAICGGFVEDGDGPLGIDVLAENGDILQTFTVSKAGFEYLRRCLRFRREQVAA
jgi:hypothetical protein